ncbi:MAG TPA: hypothetical protein PK984_04405 [Paludibacteraceae bacterium]|nr:hypothetical protein [Paludibacteraceae bacterium]HOS37438.1 hypothetical protein [Paludibacteraceae bacterium]HPK20356.1 hypothetical protein [Paludibacteraceae bacterium]
MAYEPTCVNISAAQGQPSTFWQSETGAYYRNKYDAVKDDKSKAVNPADFALKKSFWKQNKKAIIISIVIIAIGVAGYFLWKKGRLIIKTN